MKYYKLLNSNFKSSDSCAIIYKEGINILPYEFGEDRELFDEINSNYIYYPGGFHFFDETNIFKIIRLFLKYPTVFIARVRLLEDSKLISDKIAGTIDVLKTDKFILENIQSLEDFFVLNPLMISSSINHYASILKFIKNQTKDMCIQAVSNDVCELKYVKKQDNEICKIAVRQNGLALKYVNDKTNEICKIAITQNGCALEFIEDQTNELCLLAVRQNGLALCFVIKQTHEICIEAIKNRYEAFQYVKNQTEKLCLEAVKINGLCLFYIIIKTEEIYSEAIKQNGMAILFSKNPYKYT